MGKTLVLKPPMPAPMPLQDLGVIDAAQRHALLAAARSSCTWCPVPELDQLVHALRVSVGFFGLGYNRAFWG